MLAYCHARVAPALPPCGRTRAFSLLEVVVSMAILVATIGVFFTLAGRTMQLTRRGEEQALACEAFTQRHEELRALKWGQISLGKGIRDAICNHRPAALADVTMVSEQWTVSPYPGGAPAPFTVTWNGTTAAVLSPATVPATYPDLPAVKVRWVLTWTAKETSEQRTIAFETVIAKGGLHAAD
jgi:type II secretory pathway pseudopilin PulG